MAIRRAKKTVEGENTDINLWISLKGIIQLAVFSSVCLKKFRRFPT